VGVYFDSNFILLPEFGSIFVNLSIYQCSSPSASFVNKNEFMLAVAIIFEDMRLKSERTTEFARLSGKKKRN
jgi:hypothetical protein